MEHVNALRQAGAARRVSPFHTPPMVPAPWEPHVRRLLVEWTHLWMVDEGVLQRGKLEIDGAARDAMRPPHVEGDGGCGKQEGAGQGQPRPG